MSESTAPAPAPADTGATAAPTPSAPNTGNPVAGAPNVSALFGGMTAGFQNVASKMGTGIRAIGVNIDANFKDAAAGINAAASGAVAGVVQGVVVSASAASSAATSAIAGMAGQAPGGVPDVPDRTQAQVQEAVYRTRDLRKSTDSLSRRFLTREVGAAMESAGAYSRTLQAVKNNKLVLAPLHSAAGSLANQIGGARSVAAALAGTSAVASTGGSA
jgi:hypothetical protein